VEHGELARGRATAKGGTVARPEIGEAIRRGEFVPCDPCGA